MNKQNNIKEKLTDKAFSRLLITSVLGIFACIVCLCSTTYAWFSYSIPSVSNQVQTAEEFLLEVVITEDGVALPDIEGEVELYPDREYVITLTLPSGSASGYLTVTTESGETYYTDYIARHDEAEAKVVSCELVVGTAQAVTFTPRWGIYACDGDVVGGKLLIP